MGGESYGCHCPSDRKGADGIFRPALHLPHGSGGRGSGPVDNAENLLIFLLTEFDVNGETVMFAPAGGFFGTPGVGQSDIRIAYVLKAEDMKAGINIIKEGIKAYNAR